MGLDESLAARVEGGIVACVYWKVCLSNINSGGYKLIIRLVGRVVSRSHLTNRCTAEVNDLYKPI